MAKLQRDDAKTLWDEMGDKRGWKALASVLEKHVEQPKGIEESTVEAMLCMARAFGEDEEDFPGSTDKMLEMVNEYIEEFRDCAEETGKKKSQKKRVKAENGEKSGRAESKASAQKKGNKAKGKAEKSPQKESEKSSERREQAQPSASQHYNERDDFRSSSEEPVKWPGSGAEEDWQAIDEQSGQPMDARNRQSGEAGDKKSNNGEDWQQGRPWQSSSQVESDEQTTTPRSTPARAEQREKQARRMVRLTTTDPEQLHTFYKRGNFKSWDDMMAWLRRRTQGEHSYPQEMVDAMMKDMEALKAQGAKLEGEGEQTFRLRKGKVIQ